MKQVVLVTGATGSIGKGIAKLIANKSDHEIFLLCRNESKANKAVEEIKKSTGNQNVFYKLVDVSQKSSIQNLANTKLLTKI